MQTQEVLDFVKSELRLRSIDMGAGIGVTRGWDSLVQVQLMLALEQKIGLSIPPDYFGRLVTIKDILAFLDEQGKLTA